MMNMGHIYLKLLKTGNVLFKNWTATIFCDPDYMYTIRVNFGLNCDNIFGRREREQNTISSLNKTVKFLQNSYEEWLAHITEKRNQFPCLNFFQISQIVMLRTQIAEVIKSGQGKGRHHSNENIDSTFRGLFDMLFNINKNANIELLDQANSFVFGEEKNNFVEKDLEDITVEYEDTAAELDKDVQKQLEELGFSRFFSDLF